jgi:hypothetical protein
MGEICASGSVGGEGGNALAYPATCAASRRPLFASVVKGQATSGADREGESTDAQRRGGAARRSDEGSVMELERGGCVVQPRPLAN